MNASRKIREKPDLIDLNGEWVFTPQSEQAQAITVPALWESQGHLNLDGEVRYQREFELRQEQITGFATLRFEAVMDSARVTVNGKFCGEHKNPFTPFELECGSYLRVGINVIEVIVSDHHRNSVEHTRSAHGKQGWGNEAFPSPPSVYMTLGGIYRDVTLHVHESIVIRDVSSDSNPEKLKIGVEIESLEANTKEVHIHLMIFGQVLQRVVRVLPKQVSTIYIEVASGKQNRWSPENPFLHDLIVKVLLKEKVVDVANLRIGLRSLKEENGKILINDEEIFIKAALVQGFYPDTIYGEPSDEKIRDEVIKAKSLGLNTLRLHIKAFDTRYLDICDELGMLLHCDIPIAEPIAHDELGSEGELAENCRDAIIAQVRRDYSHPSIFLWSVMNELGLEKISVRQQEGYKAFAIAMYEALLHIDKTRPIIENDWIEPDPDYIFRSNILTSHWYGRLDLRYLMSLKLKTQNWGRDGRFFYVSEFGDWGLPNMPHVDDSVFWSYHNYYAQSVQNLPWCKSQQDLIEGTQRYMGVSDKLQIEIFRSTDGVNGFCVTELTDIPWELNGLLDYRRNIKEGVSENFRIATQEVLPVIEFDYAGAESRQKMPINLHVHNSSSKDMAVRASVQFKSSTPISIDLNLMANSVSHSMNLEVSSQIDFGLDELEITLFRDEIKIAANSYKVPIYPILYADLGRSINMMSETGVEILKEIGFVHDGNSQSYIVGENALTPELGDVINARLHEGASVLVLAQSIGTSEFLPVDVGAISSTTEWGGTDFHFTTENSEVFPPNTILTIEDLNIRADVIFSRNGELAWPEVTYAGVFKPLPRPRTGYILGRMNIGRGKLITCQYRLNETRHLTSTQKIATLILNLVN